MNEIRKNIPESELCFCFLFGIRIGTALTLCLKNSDKTKSPRLVRCPTRPSSPVRGVRNAPDRTGRLDGLVRLVSGDSEILSVGQSQVSDGQPCRTSGTDTRRVRNVTEIFFFWIGGDRKKMGGTKHFPKERKSRDL